MKFAERMARLGGISLSQAARLELQLTEILATGLLDEGEVRINGFGVMRIERRSGKAWDPKKRRRVARRVKRVVKWQGSKNLTQGHEEHKEKQTKEKR